MNTISSISSLNSTDSVKLASLLRQIGKKFYLKKTSCLHLSSEEFMSDTWSDRTRVEYHGLSIVLERWSWNGQDGCNFRLYYKDIEINPFQWEELVKYAKVILWYLSKYEFRRCYRTTLFKDEIAEMLGLKDELNKLEKKSKKVRNQLFSFLTK